MNTGELSRTLNPEAEQGDVFFVPKQAELGPVYNIQAVGFLSGMQGTGVAYPVPKWPQTNARLVPLFTGIQGIQGSMGSSGWGPLGPRMVY